MNQATQKVASPPPEWVEPMPRHFSAELIVTPPDNPVYTPATLADLLESMREHRQLVPGWVCPSPDLPEQQRLCLEGNRRLAVARQLGLPFWAFDLGRFVPEEERIRLTFHHNGTRRQMSREETAERAARWMEITGSTAVNAAKLLNVSPATLSRAFGERRIPAALKPRADRLGLSVRSIIAAAPPALMEAALAYAESNDPVTGKPPTRDAIDLHIRQLKKGGMGKERKPKAIRLELDGRAISVCVTEGDIACDVAKELKAIAAKLGGLGEMPPDGWPYHFD